MHNAVDLEKFKFNKDIRESIRKKLGISDSCYVIGHVGRFTYQKTMSFD